MELIDTWEPLLSGSLQVRNALDDLRACQGYVTSDFSCALKSLFEKLTPFLYELGRAFERFFEYSDMTHIPEGVVYSRTTLERGLHDCLEDIDAVEVAQASGCAEQLDLELLHLAISLKWLSDRMRGFTKGVQAGVRQN